MMEKGNGGYSPINASLLLSKILKEKTGDVNQCL